MRMRNVLVVAVSVLALSVPGCGGAGGGNISAGQMPSGGSWHGQWQSPQYGNMHLCVTGAQVMGDFENNERRGSIQGTIQGDLLRFTWEQRHELVIGRPTVTSGRGYFRYQVGEDNDHYFRGEWGHDDAVTGGGPWNGVRMRNRDPERCLRTSGGSTDDDDGESYDSYGDEEESYDDEPEPDSDLEGLDDY